MKNPLFLLKEDFKDESQFTEFTRKQKDIKRKAIIIRFGILFVICLVGILFVIIIVLMSKNNRIDHQSNNISITLPKNIRSDILNHESYDLLTQWIPNLNKDNYTLNRLFKATHDGCHPQSFINSVSDNKPTVILAISKEGNIFGGYTEQSWDNPMEDSNAFLFSISNKEKYLVQESKRAIEWNTNIIVRFGTTDLIIVDDCLNRPSSTSVGSGIYKMRHSLNPTQEIAFYLKEIEAFVLKEIK